MPSQQQVQYMKNRKRNSGGTVNPESYANTIFCRAFEAPFDSIVQDPKTDLKAAFKVVKMAAYVQEKVCKSWGKLEDSDIIQGSDYQNMLRDEKERLKASPELDDDDRHVMLAYFKLSLILEKIQGSKGRAEELEV